MQYKLESISTVGRVNVTRATLTHADNSFSGYNWTVSFLDAQGDLPMMTADLTYLTGFGGGKY